MPSALTPASIRAPAEARGWLPFRFGPRFFFLLVLGFAWVIPAWWAPSFVAVLFAWDAMAVVLFVIDLLRLPRPSSLIASRIWPAPLTLLHPASVRVTIESSSRTPLNLSLLDQLPLSLRSDPVEMSVVFSSAEPRTSEYAVLPTERGDARAGKLYLRYRSPLGLAERWASAPLQQTVTVLPDLPEANRQALYVLRTRHSGIEKQKRRYAGFGREFEALREYQDGDELRDVSWTATARRAQLITRTYSAERSQTVWIVVDAGRLLRGRIQENTSGLTLSKLDYAVNAALSVARVALLQGDQVGLLAYGRGTQRMLMPASGPSHLRAMVEALARVRGETQEADHGRAARTLLHKQTRRALVVWITDFADTPGTPDVIEYVSIVGRRHLVLLTVIAQPDLAALARRIPASETDMFRQAAALELVDRRDVLLRQLREHGVLALELAPHLATAALVSEYLRVKDRNLL